MSTIRALQISTMAFDTKDETYTSVWIFLCPYFNRLFRYFPDYTFNISSINKINQPIAFPWKLEFDSIFSTKDHQEKEKKNPIFIGI